MLSLTVRLGKDLGKVWSRLKGVKRTKRGKYGKMKRWNKNSPRLWRVKMLELFVINFFIFLSNFIQKEKNCMF